jgi:hypothetical protein
MQVSHRVSKARVGRYCNLINQRYHVEIMVMNENKNTDEIFEKLIKIVSAIKSKHGIDDNFIPKEDIADSMPCPLCDGKEQMDYFISSYNGHRHARCGCFGTFHE